MSTWAGKDLMSFLMADYDLRWKAFEELHFIARQKKGRIQHDDTPDEHEEMNLQND